MRSSAFSPLSAVSQCRPSRPTRRCATIRLTGLSSTSSTRPRSLPALARAWASATEGAAGAGRCSCCIGVSSGSSAARGPACAARKLVMAERSSDMPVIRGSSSECGACISSRGRVSSPPCSQTRRRSSSSGVRRRLRCRAMAVERTLLRSTSTRSKAQVAPRFRAVRRRVSASWVVSVRVRMAPHSGAAWVTRWRRFWSVLSSSTRAPLRSVRWPWMSPAALSSGISNQKVEPRPGCDSTPMLPPIRSTMRLQITRPRPVPPYRRVVLASAWLKARNRRSALPSGMPMPVSATSKRNSCWVRPSPRRLTDSVTEPRSVNFTALLSRLVSTWRRRTGSPRTARRTAGSICRVRRRPLLSAGFSISRITESSSSRRLKLVVSRVTLFASSLE